MLVHIHSVEAGQDAEKSFSKTENIANYHGIENQNNSEVLFHHLTSSPLPFPLLPHPPRCF